MATKIDLSILIPTYNRSRYIRQTLEDMLPVDRDGLTVEFVIIDNNSSDDTREAVEAYADRLPVRYLFEPTPGKNAALNKALNEADVLNGPVNDYGNYFEDAHVQEVEAISWIEVDGIGRIPVPRLTGFGPAREGDPRLQVPAIGEHSAEVLARLGYAEADIARLGEAGAVKLGAA